MKPRIEFIVPGPPVPAARPRVVPLYGKGKRLITDAGGRPILHAYTEDKTEEYEQRVAFCARAALARYPAWNDLALSDAVFRVHLHFVRNVARGDLDNFQKAALDGIKKANEYKPHPTERVRGKPRMLFVRGLFRDDSRITQSSASMHTDPKAEPRTEVLLETASMTLEEPLWLRCALEAGMVFPRSPSERPQPEPTIPTLGDAIER